MNTYYVFNGLSTIRELLQSKNGAMFAEGVDEHGRL